MKSIKRAATALFLGAMLAFPLAAGADEARPLGVVEAIRIATEACISGYPLVTFDMVRKQQTNVATPDAEHAPMGQAQRGKWWGNVALRPDLPDHAPIIRSFGWPRLQGNRLQLDENADLLLNGKLGQPDAVFPLA